MMVKGFDDDVEWSASETKKKSRKFNLSQNAPSIISISQFNFPVQFPLLPFVCWFVKSPVSVSKDSTKSASSSESGSADVGSCSVEFEREEKSCTIENYDWNINDI